MIWVWTGLLKTEERVSQGEKTKTLLLSFPEDGMNQIFVKYDRLLFEVS